MRIIGLLFVIFFFLFLIFGKINIRGRNAKPWERFLISIVAGAVFAFMIGLPGIGIYALMKGYVR